MSAEIKREDIVTDEDKKKMIFVEEHYNLYKSGSITLDEYNNILAKKGYISNDFSLPDEEEEEENLSGCCGATIIDNIGLCSDCKEHCE